MLQVGQEVTDAEREACKKKCEGKDAKQCKKECKKDSSASTEEMKVEGEGYDADPALTGESR